MISIKPIPAKHPLLVGLTQAECNSRDTFNLLPILANSTLPIPNNYDSNPFKHPSSLLLYKLGVPSTKPFHTNVFEALKTINSNVCFYEISVPRPALMSDATKQFDTPILYYLPKLLADSLPKSEIQAQELALRTISVEDLYSSMNEIALSLNSNEILLSNPGTSFHTTSKVKRIDLF